MRKFKKDYRVVKAIVKAHRHLIIIGSRENKLFFAEPNGGTAIGVDVDTKHMTAQEILNTAVSIKK